MAAILGASGVAVVVALAIVPVSHRFSDGFNATSEFGGVTLVAPEGSSISLNWSVTGGPAWVSVYNGHGQVLYVSSAASGDFSFTSATPSDGVEANSSSSAYVYLGWSYVSALL